MITLMHNCIKIITAFWCNYKPRLDMSRKKFALYPEVPERNVGLKRLRAQLMAYESALEKADDMRKPSEAFAYEKSDENYLTPPPSMYFSPKYQVLREIYRYVSDKLVRESSKFQNENMSGEAALFERLAKVHDFPPRTKRNPFNYMLVYLADLKCLSGSTAFRSKYARCMQYAYDHKIEPMWLQSFIEMSGGINLVAQKYIEKENEFWVEEIFDKEIKIFRKKKKKKKKKKSG